MPYVCMLGCVRVSFAKNTQLRDHIQEEHDDIYTPTITACAKGVLE